MDLLVTPQPLAAAVAKLGAKTPVAATLRTAEWRDVPLALRERAQFSAGVEQVRLVQQIQQKLADALSLRKEQVANGEAFVDRSSFIGDLRKAAIASGASDGTGELTDIASRARGALIFDTQVQSAYGYAAFKRSADPDVLNGTPAQELTGSTARMPRADWGERWIAACGRAGDDKAADVYDRTGRMVALKTSAVWRELNSDFGVPWPPFAFGSTRMVRDIFREEAEELGLVAADDVLEPVQVDALNAELEAEIPPDTRDWLLNVFGDRVEISADGTARWKGAA